MSGPEETVAVAVESVGVRGDGIAHHAGERLFIPFAAPGDRLRVTLGQRQGEGRAAQIAALLAPGARTAPVCRHFGACGGCTLQHLAPAAYAAAKEGWLRTALAQHGLGDAPVAPLRRLPPGTRRRARFAVASGRRGAVIGFHARASHSIVDMEECAVLHPALLRLVAPLRRAAPRLWPAGAGFATATWCDGGVDLLLELAAPPGLAALEAMAGFAAAEDVARLAWQSGGGAATPVALRRPARVILGGVAVALPGGAFLQASVEAEAALAAAVLAGVGDASPVADLYAGLGTFSFALAAAVPGRRVHAVEGDGAAAAALARAAAQAGLGGRVTLAQRDLAARPLTAAELAGFAAVVFDPPRAGAVAQSRALAQAQVPRVVAVSCNPASFARDARILVEGGYRLAAVAPIDAFPWSAQLELVARFDRA